MLDVDLATLYEVKTGNLNLAVRRHSNRFPKDFMFQLTRAEFQTLRLQSAISINEAADDISLMHLQNKAYRCYLVF
jgi:hypothetical protein